MENKYLLNGNKKDCNGCGVCTMFCPVNAIHMQEDEEGFFYPKIDEEKCINCGACKRICSNFNDSKLKSDVYAARVKDPIELGNSSSGGMYYVLAKYVIKNGGEVFGVEYGENLKVQHNHYDNLEDCKKFRGSKYCRSDLKNSYREAKKFLDKGKLVLFTGTSCQCNGLKTFLKKDYDNLILCDVLCHANPSQKIMDLYFKEIEEYYHKKIIDVEFRAKVTGWHDQIPVIIFNDGSYLNDGSYFKAFVSELINRISCYSCAFASKNRVTDFTIGDLWGIDKILPELKDDDKGESLLLVNSKKGKDLFEKIKDEMDYIKIENDLPYKFNHFANVPVNKNRDKFFKAVGEGKSVIKSMKKYR